MLAVIYLFATAKPISIRRLSALFVVMVTLAAPLLTTLRDRNVFSDAIVIAASLTLLVWSAPLVRAIHSSLFRRTARTDSLRNVSGSVQLTYAFVLAVTPLITISVMIHHSGNVVRLGDLLGLLTMACVVALVVQILFTQRPLRGRFIDKTVGLHIQRYDVTIAAPTCHRPR